MFWLSVFAVATAWVLQQVNAQPLLAVPAPAWAAGALVLWRIAGGRAALVLVAAGWTLCRANGLIETRLPAHLANRDVVVRGVVCDFPRADPEAMRLILDREPDGSLPVTDVNPRFGGGFPLPTAAGSGFPELALALARGERPEPRLGEFREGVLMTRFFSQVILERGPDGLEPARDA